MIARKSHTTRDSLTTAALRFRHGIAIAAVSCSMLASVAWGQTTWSGSEGSWWDIGNWDSGIAPLAGQILIHNGGTARISDGATATGGQLMIGTAGSATGSGTLLLENASKLETTGGAVLGRNGSGGPATRRGEIILDGIGTKWTNSGGTLSLGDASFTGAVGSGHITIRNGAVLEHSGTATTLGGPAPQTSSNLSQASLTVTGSGSLFTTGGTFTMGNGGPASVTVANGGTLAMTGGTRTLSFGDRNASHAWINIGAAYGEAATGAGILDIARIDGGTASATTLRNLHFNHSDSDYYFSSNGTTTGTGVQISGQMSVVVSAGSTTLMGSQTYQRRTDVNSGTLRLAANGSITNSSAFWIGNTAGTTGALIVESGAKIGSDVSGGYKLVRIGTSAGATGIATLRGAGAEWWTASTQIGSFGTGTLNIESGAAVHGNTTASVGVDALSIGTVTVTGAGSLWRVSGSQTGIDVGLGGKGTLNIENSGSVVSGFGYIGNSSGSEGTVSIKGAGSQWTSNGNIDVGSNGKGTLNLENGGKLSATGNFLGGITLGRYAAAEGTVKVTGANSRLEWQTADLIVGKAGKGTLEISGGGLVTYTGSNPFADSEIHVASEAGSTGVIKLNGTGEDRGVLEVRQVVKGAGTGSIEFDGGTLRARYVEEDFLANFSTGDIILKSGGGTIDTNGRQVTVNAGLTGAGGLRKTGQGTLILEGDNNHAGPTEVLQGRLVVNGDMSSSIGVAEGASLGGNGSFSGQIVIASGAGIAPGNSAGTMHFTGDLTLDTAAVYSWELAAYGTNSGTDSDLLSISGAGKTMTFSSGTLLELHFIEGVLGPDDEGNGFWLVDHEWVIARASDGASLVNEGLILADTSPWANGGFTILNRGNEIILSYSAVPEPSALLFSIVGLGLLVRRRR